MADGATLQSLQERLNYHFSDPELLQQALTHRSFGASHNERMEFLGDAVLGLIVTGLLYEQFSSMPEGQMSRLRAELVRQSSLCDIARELRLGEALRLGSGELASGGQQRDSILADVLEALIGAMYIDSDMATVNRLVCHWIKPRLATLDVSKPIKDPKSQLQELMQALGKSVPVYHLLKSAGKAHERVFHVRCEVAGVQQECMGQGSSRREAEQNAASACLALLEDGA